MNNIIVAMTINIVIAIIVVVGTQMTLKRLAKRQKKMEPATDERLFALALTCSEYEKTSGGRLKSYFDTDQALMCDPETLNKVSRFIVGTLKKFPDEKICFVEKDSGPIGSLVLSGLISSMTKRPMSIIRTRRDVKAMSVKGSKLTSGDKVVLIQDVVTTGFQVLLAAMTIEKLGAQIVAVVSVLDREEEKLEDFKKRDIALYSYQYLSSAPQKKSIQERNYSVAPAC